MDPARESPTEAKKLGGPPRPRLVFRVGVTGHRQLSDSAGVARSIGTVLEKIEQTVLQVHEEAQGRYADTRPELRIISPLAEGTDTVAAEVGLARKWVLHSPLPFAREDYANDFTKPEALATYERLLTSAAAILELDGRRDSTASREHPATDAAYAWVGRIVLGQSDLILAVWDGLAARGRGGTAEIIEDARRRGKPVVRIDPAQPTKLTWLTQGDLAEGTETVNLLDRIGEEVRAQVSLIGFERQAEIDAYLAVKQPRYRGLGPVWSTFRNLICDIQPYIPQWRIAPFEEAAARDWAPHRAEVREKSAILDTEIVAPVQGAYAWADGLAVYYADLYRSAFVLNYTLAALAVVTALIGYLLHGGKDFWAPAEFLVILVIIVNTWIAAGDSHEKHGKLNWFSHVRHWIVSRLLGGHTDYHHRFRNYRVLSERLRLLRDMALVPVPLTPVGGPPFSRPSDLPTDWIDSLFRAYARSLPLPCQRLDASRVRALGDLFARYQIGMETTDNRQATGQLGYHLVNRTRLNLLEQRLRSTGTGLFILTAALCAILLSLVWSTGPELEDSWPVRALTFLCATLPAVAAAVYGIRSQGDFARLAERSASMVTALRDLGHQLEPVPSEELTSSQLSKIETETASVMLQEVIDWQVSIGVKHLELP